MLWLGPTTSTDSVALKEGHVGKSTGFWGAHFAHRFRLSLDRRGAAGNEGVARPLRDLWEEEQVQTMHRQTMHLCRTQSKKMMLQMTSKMML